MKKKIFISVFCLKDIGGISTSAYNLLVNICKRYDVTLCITSNYKSNRYLLPHEIQVVSGSDALGDRTIDRKYLSDQTLFQKLVRNMRRIERKLGIKCIYKDLDSLSFTEYYDAALAFTDFYFVDKGNRIRYDYYNVINNVNAKIKIAWIHNDPTKMAITSTNASIIFKGFNYIVNVSINGKEIFDRVAPNLASKSFVVYNTYNIDQIKEKASEYRYVYDGSKLHFVTVGRVSNRQKKMDRIVEVCHLLKEDGYDNFDWTIVGNGESKVELEEKTKSYGLSNILRFVGAKSNPYPYMQEADAFILTSLYEGLPMTVREAEILETPCLITNFGSAHEAVIDAVQGEVCENSTEGVYNMVKSILVHPDKLKLYNVYLKENPVTNDVAIRQLDDLINGKYETKEV